MMLGIQYRLPTVASIQPLVISLDILLHRGHVLSSHYDTRRTKIYRCAEFACQSELLRQHIVATAFPSYISACEFHHRQNSLPCRVEYIGDSLNENLECVCSRKQHVHNIQLAKLGPTSTTAQTKSPKRQNKDIDTTIYSTAPFLSVREVI
jgi:hypothetical protein